MSSTVDQSADQAQITELVSSSSAALPGVLTLGERKGASAPTMRVRGLPATLSPLVGKAAAQLVGLRVQGGPTAE
eukprot:1262492-Pleurochrysis_carterae.AAC.1